MPLEVGDRRTRGAGRRPSVVMEATQARVSVAVAGETAQPVHVDGAAAEVAAVGEAATSAVAVSGDRR